MTANKRCCLCEKEFTEYVQEDKKEQPYGALHIEIHGYFGSAVFDGTDLTGERYVGDICDSCGVPLIASMRLMRPRRAYELEDADAKPEDDVGSLYDLYNPYGGPA